ncbi:MAG: holo-ACP synthase [Gammaproteobacteria bacterium AqS3]|nr:holo-ACP synthase [Gammaproteobacteria bacterium AqS3]
MIRGVGIDVLERARFSRVHERFGERFARRLLCPDELGVYQSLAGAGAREAFLAKAFCAKEAVSKALGTGLGAGVRFSDIELCTRPGRRLRVVLHQGAADWCRQRGAEEVLMSFSSERTVLVAVAVLQ